MIRRAEMIERDISGIQGLIQMGVESGHLLPRTREEIAEIIEQKHFWIAENGLGIIGCAALEVYSQRLAEVRSVAVFPTFRRNKLGSLLVGKCIEEARNLAVQEVLSITDQLQFFEGLGFRRQLRGQYPLFLKLSYEEEG